MNLRKSGDGETQEELEEEVGEINDISIVIHDYQQIKVNV